MNKILIALVLAVVMSGNVYSKVYIHCSFEEDIGFIIDVKGNDSSFIHREGESEKFSKRNFNTLKVEPNFIEFSLYYQDWYKIDRKTLVISKGLPYRWYGDCSLAKNKPDLFNILRKKYNKKTKGNKF